MKSHIRKDIDKPDFFLFSDALTPVKRIIIYSSLVIITFIVFSPSLKDGFVKYDDHLYVTENNLITSISLHDLSKFGENVAGNFHPLTMVSLAVDYHFFGLNPFYYHLKNILFHLFNTILVFLFIMQVSKKNVFVSFFTALIFGIHPMHVESVTWISERKDVLYSFYFLIGLLLYYLYLKKKQKIYFIATILSFVLSTLAKSAAVVFPVVLFLIDFYEGRKFNSSLVLEKVPMLIVSLIVGIIALQTQTSSGAIEIGNFTFGEKILYSTSGFITYIRKFIYPNRLANFHPYPDQDNNTFNLIFSVIIAILLIIYLIQNHKKHLKVFWGLTFYFITIALVLQMLQVGGAYISERYTYIPYIGIGFIYFTLIKLFINKYKKFRLIILSTLILQLTIYAKITYSQTKVWKDTATLWTNFNKSYPDNSSAGYAYRGNYYYETGDTLKAFNDFNNAIKANSNNYKAYAMRGKLYFDQKKYNLSIKDFSSSIKLRPNYTDAILNRGAVFFNIKDYKNALNDFNKVLSKDSLNISALSFRGSLYFNTGEIEKARSDFEKVLTVDDNNKGAVNSLNAIKRLYGDSQINGNVDSTIEKNPDDYEALANRAKNYFDQEKFELALKDYNTVLELKENFDIALKGRSAVYFNLKKFEEAANDISDYLKQHPNNYDMLSKRAICYVNLAQFEKALLDYNKLIEFNPGVGYFYQNRSFMNVRLGNRDDALNDILKAKELGVKVDEKYVKALQQ